MSVLPKTTLCFLVNDNQVCLAMKKRGFGEGKWNGVGGKVEQGETVRQSALREMHEEIGVVSEEEHLDHVANLRFHFSHKPEWDQDVHVFLVRAWDGEPAESEEMRPVWYTHTDIPFENMWADDPHWLPHVLTEKKIEAVFHFGEDGESFYKHTAKEVDSLYEQH